MTRLDPFRVSSWRCGRRLHIWRATTLIPFDIAPDQRGRPQYVLDFIDGYLGEGVCCPWA